MQNLHEYLVNINANDEAIELVAALLTELKNLVAYIDEDERYDRIVANAKVTIKKAEGK